MSFGQSSGPPATGKQLRELTELLEAAGHTDFRDARGPMGFTQRQAGGKFTRDEADAFIEQLEAEVHGEGPPADSRLPAASRAEPARSSKIAPRPPNDAPSKIAPRQANRAPSKVAPRAAAKVALNSVPSEALAAELQRRGWAVLEP